VIVFILIFYSEGTTFVWEFFSIFYINLAINLINISVSLMENTKLSGEPKLSSPAAPEIKNK